MFFLLSDDIYDKQNEPIDVRWRWKTKTSVNYEILFKKTPLELLKVFCKLFASVFLFK